MLAIPYPFVMAAITLVWILVRLLAFLRSKTFSFAREAQLLLVYICIVVVTRFTFFPFSKVDGAVQPLMLYFDKIWPFRINLLPFVYLLDYPTMREALLNFIGNYTMFIPLGVVWPIVFRQLDTHKKVIAAGVGYSLLIEIVQLPFFDRVSDIDDLILNSLGYLTGYGIYLLFRMIRRALRRR